MGFVSNWPARLRTPALAVRSTAEERQARREGRPMYAFVLVVLAILFAEAVRTSPGLLAPGRLATFSGLMLLHGYLHWRCPLLAVRPALALPYLVVQGALAVAAVEVSGTPAMAVGLFSTLVGVAAGTVRDKRLGVAAAAAYLGLEWWTLGRMQGWRGVSTVALVGLSTALFALFFALAYRRQWDARQRVQSLLGELTEAHDRLAEHALRIEDLTLAAERQRMARELHDTLAQGLAGLILQIEAATDHLGEGREARASTILRHSLARARQTLAEARDAIAGLREDRPSTRDLGSAIRIEADRFTRASGIPCRLEVDALSDVAADACEQGTRIVAEALANVAQHSRASAVALSAQTDGSEVSLVIEDDGIGFEAALEASRPGHYGLMGMRERARMAGGAFRLEASPGRGTRVEVRLPRREGRSNG
jgi:NarL family two-component system sensor histidine kinase YdfH